VVAGVIFALLPDVDYFLVFWDRLSFLRHHRGFTHSLLALPLLALGGALVGKALGGGRWFRPLFTLGLLVVASHLLLDLGTSYGTQLLSPFSRQKLTLDWIFIIDPYLTLILVGGVAASFFLPHLGRHLGHGCLAVAGAYFLLCGLYHHQAQALARQVFGSGEVIRVAAIPQPFSCRRWQLLAAGPGECRQIFVELPPLAFLGMKPQPAGTEAIAVPNPTCRVPGVSYRPPGELQVLTWTGTGLPTGEFPPEVRRLLNIYLEFTRFPVLHRVQTQGEGQLLQWLDLRFSVPGRAFPFVLQLSLDPQGRLKSWGLGRCRDEGG
jgi:membrane-bound metal-dependent hydrolase YbcI (DUF457 family)